MRLQQGQYPYQTWRGLILTGACLAEYKTAIISTVAQAIEAVSASPMTRTNYYQTKQTWHWWLLTVGNLKHMINGRMRQILW